MAQLFSAFSPELRPELQLLLGIFDIEAGIFYDPVHGKQCYGPNSPDGCECNACKYRYA